MSTRFQNDFINSKMEISNKFERNLYDFNLKKAYGNIQDYLVRKQDSINSVDLNENLTTTRTGSKKNI